MNNKLFLQVEATGHISTAIKQALSLAQKIDVVVYFDFNGVKVYVRPESDPQEVESNYTDELKNKGQTS